MWFRKFYQRSRPRKAKGGIKAESRQGSFGKSWWAKRWIAVLESFNLGARLGRGRTYARQGQVLSIDIEEGRVEAKVQGSRATPYRVTIEVEILSREEWDRVIDQLSRQALFVAKLLSGEMPQDIESVFGKVKLSLFPIKRELQTDCSCPDWSNPCKHIAAVYYLLGEEFDRDPFLIFRMRGLSREELLKRLGEAGVPAVEEETGAEAPTEPAPKGPAEPLGADPARFWQMDPVPEEVFGEVERPGASAGWPRRLGSFPFWRGHQPLLDALDPLYRQASQRGLDAYLGEPEAPAEEAGK
jgi:uncharacterized Zn finger protein